MTQKLTAEEKSIYKRNVDYFISKLEDYEDCGSYETDNVELEIDTKLNVHHLKINSISKELEDEIKNAINKSLRSLMGNFEGHTNKWSHYHIPYIDDLEITFSDYIEYVLKK